MSWSKFKWFSSVFKNTKTLRAVCNGATVFGKQIDRPSRQYIKKGPGLEYFIYNNTKESTDKLEVVSPEKHPYLNKEARDGSGLKGKYHSKNYLLVCTCKLFIFPVFVEVYGCQMNVNDTEIVHSVLEKHNYVKATSSDDADIILLMTCAIREGAEGKIWHRLGQLKAKKQERKSRKEDLTVGIIGINNTSTRIPFTTLFFSLGCMAERLKDKLLEKGSVDIVAGPDSYRSLPYLLSHVSSHQVYCF